MQASQATKALPTMHEAMSSDDLNTFYASFDLLNKESAVKSTLTPEDLPLLASTVYVRGIMQKANVSKAAGPFHIPDHVPTTYAK